MARPPKGKPLKFRPIRLDDEVWAECQRLGKEHGTINEGLRSQLFSQESEYNPPIPEVPKIAKLNVNSRPFKGELLRPSAKKKKSS